MELGVQFGRAAVATLRLIGALLVIFSVLAAIRVWLETLIVIFSIAESLASIDRKTRSSRPA